MAAVELLTLNPKTETQIETSMDLVEQEIQSVLDQAKKPQEQRGPQASHWYYRTVCPGVRYYSY